MCNFPNHKDFTSTSIPYIILPPVVIKFNNSKLVRKPTANSNFQLPRIQTKTGLFLFEGYSMAQFATIPMKQQSVTKYFQTLTESVSLQQLQGWLAGWDWMALLTQIKSYCAFKVSNYFEKNILTMVSFKYGFSMKGLISKYQKYK